MGDRWSVVPPPPRTSACGRVGMWAQRHVDAAALRTARAESRPLYVLWRSLRMALLTLMVAAVTAVVTLAMTLVG